MIFIWTFTALSTPTRASFGEVLIYLCVDTLKLSKDDHDIILKKNLFNFSFDYITNDRSFFLHLTKRKLKHKECKCWTCRCYQELKSPKLVLPLGFLAAAALVDGPLSSSAAERFLSERRMISSSAGISCSGWMRLDVNLFTLEWCRLCLHMTV